MTAANRPYMIWVLLLVACCVALSACGDKSSSSSSPTAPSAANRQPSVTITASPSGQAIMGATNMTFTAVGNDPDGDPLTYSWNFGDGTTAPGATVTRVFNSAGTFNVTVTASDGKGATGSATQVLTVRDLTGFWRGGQAGLTEALDIDHKSGNQLTGKVTTGVKACGGRLSGTVTHPRTVAISIDFAGVGCNLGLERYDGTVEPLLQSMSGTYQIGNARFQWTFTR